MTFALTYLTCRTRTFRKACSIFIKVYSSSQIQRNFSISLSLNSSWGSKKIRKYKPLYVSKIMAELDPKVAEILAPLRMAVKEQGLLSFSSMNFNQL